MTSSYLTTRAYVKIQDGCNNFCSYCLIPYVRGRSRSRDKDDILLEIKNLINNGIKEVVLTGIDMSSYGLDRNDDVNFSDLIELILINFPSLYRLRISSLEESQIDDKFMMLLSKYKNLANHLHIPLQSGSEKVVKRMNRKYNLLSFEEKINRIRSIRPDISITTDVIVGFPGENEEDFMDTYNFCKKVNFSKIHVFPYSEREGTVATKLDNKVSPTTKKERVQRLLDLSKNLEENYISKFWNKDIEFLFEDFIAQRQSYRGHSSNYLECEFASQEDLTNKVKTIRFTKDNFKYFWQCQKSKIR